MANLNTSSISIGPPQVDEGSGRLLFVLPDGSMAALTDAGRPILTSDLHAGWRIGVLVHLNAGQVAVLCNEDERALWFFDPAGQRTATSYEDSGVALRAELAALLGLVLAIHPGASVDRVLIQAAWARHSEVLTVAAVAPILADHIRSLSVVLIDHERDDVIEASLGLSRPVEGGELAQPAGLSRLGDVGLFYDALKSGQIVTADPVTGAVLEGAKSIYVENYLIAYPVTGRDGHGLLLGCGSALMIPAVLYRPEAAILYVTNRPEMSHAVVGRYLGELCADMVRNYRKLVPYLLASDNGRPAPIVFISHIGHHLWNELSGLERAFQMGGLSSIHRFYVLHPDQGEHFGHLDVLFDLPAAEIDRIRDGHAFPGSAYLRNDLLLRLSEAYIPESLTNRLSNSALAREQQFVASVRTELAAADVRLLISPRFENRSWVNQAAELIAAIEDLLAQGLRVCLAVDGHNSNDGERMFASHDEKAGVAIVDQERAFVRELSDAFEGRVGLIDNIGGTVSRSVALARLCDLFVIPWGAAMAKYKWAAGAWGIVASNRYAVSAKGDRFIYESPRYVGGATADIWFSAEDIEDLEPETPDMHIVVRDRGNFLTAEGALIPYLRQAIEALNAVAAPVETEVS